VWYITFSGESPAPIRTVSAYADDGGCLNVTVLEQSTAWPIKELRGLGFGPGGSLYVVDSASSKKVSAILQYNGTPDSNGTHAFEWAYTATDQAKGLMHPFAFTFGADGSCFVSCQDSNVVLHLAAPGGSGAGVPLAVALALAAIKDSTFILGTFVASSNGKLPDVPCVATNVAQPMGLDVAFVDTMETKVANSVRDVLFSQEAPYPHEGSVLFVADEPGNAVKVYDLDGNLLVAVADATLIQSPVHLCLNDGMLYIGCNGRLQIGTIQVTGWVVCYTLATGTLATTPSIVGLRSVGGMGIGGDGALYVADRKACVVYRWDGEALAQFIPPTSGQSLPDEPEFLLYVADPQKA
jgi:hypothetical protein